MAVAVVVAAVAVAVVSVAVVVAAVVASVVAAVAVAVAAAVAAVVVVVVLPQSADRESLARRSNCGCSWLACSAMTHPRAGARYLRRRGGAR